MAIPDSVQPDGEDILEVLDIEGEAPLDDDDSDGDYESHDEGSQDERMPVEDESIHSFEGHAECVLAVAWCPTQPDLVATGGQDDRGFIWRVGQDAYESTSGSMSTHELEGHTDTVASIGFSCMGNYLATGGMDGVVKVWDSSNGQLVRTLEGPGGAVEWVKWHPKGNVVLAGSEDMTMWMWLAASGDCMQVFSGHSGPVTAGAFTPDGKTVLSVGGDDDMSLRAWNPKSGECTLSVSGHGFHEAGLTCISPHHDSSLVLTGSEDGSVCITNITLSRQSAVLARVTWHEESVEAVGWSQHLPLVASAGVDGFLRIWDSNNSSIERSKCEHPDAITKLAWHPTQPLVFTACVDGVARCWDLRTGGLVRSYSGHTDTIQDLALSPDGSMLLTGSDDHTAKVFLTAGHP